MIHYIGGRTLGVKLCLHEIHVGCYVGEKSPIALTQIINRLAFGCTGNAILGTLAMAGKEPAAVSTLLSQGITLISPESQLLGR